MINRRERTARVLLRHLRTWLHEDGCLTRQAEIAEALGINRSTLSLWLNGHTVPNFDSLKKIAAFLNTKLNTNAEGKRS